MRLLPLLLLVLGFAPLAAVTVEVLEVKDAENILVRYNDLQFTVPMAHVALSQDPELRQEAIAYLKKHLEGERTRMTYRDEFGLTKDQRTPVHLSIGRDNMAEELVERGLASYVPGKDFDRAFERDIKSAEARAKEAGKGMWAEDASPEAKPEDPIAVAKQAQKPREDVALANAQETEDAVVAELGSRHYYPVDDKRVSNINPQRLIVYKNAESAEQAGKRAAPAPASAQPETSRANAREAFESGKQLYVAAIDAGNSHRRDQLYEQAFQQLSVAVRMYANLAQTTPGDEELASEMREAMQLRYGAMKQRRF